MSNKAGSRWITPHKRLAIYIRDGFTCVYCNRDLRNATKREVTLDHVIPRIQGGSNVATNLITACLRCNSSRRDRFICDFMPLAYNNIVEQTQAPLNIALAKAIIAGEFTLDEQC